MRTTTLLNKALFAKSGEAFTEVSLPHTWNNLDGQDGGSDYWRGTADRPYMTLTHYRESLSYGADIVVFMMGSNDSKPENWISAENFKEDLLTLLDSYGEVELILCTPAAAFFLEGLTEGVTSHDIQPLVVDEIADICREVAQERGCTLIDVHALTAAHPEWFTKDGVHPSNEGAAAIAQTVYDVITGR